MKYKVNRKYERLKVKGVYNDCIELIGKGSTDLLEIQDPVQLRLK